MTKKTLAIIGMGSSQGKKKKILENSAKKIAELGKNFKISSFHTTQPWGGVAENTFLNAVCSVETHLTPIELLNALQKIEQEFGRIREKKWADRTLDLDILYFGDETIHTPRLTVPHPLIEKRDFVLKPLLEIYPEKRSK